MVKPYPLKTILLDLHIRQSIGRQPDLGVGRWSEFFFNIEKRVSKQKKKISEFRK